MTIRRRSILVALALTLSTAAVAPLSAQPVVVKFASLVPDGSVWDKALRDAGAQWSQATQGRVSLRVYPGGVAGDEPDVVRKMRIGQIQAAALTTSGLAEIDPAFEVFGVPMFFDSYPELDAVIAKLEPMLRQRLEARGFVLLNWAQGGWVHFFTRQPVSTLDDLKKAKMFVWAGDDRMVQLWRASGFHPVPLAATDILTGLQTGMIEAFPTTPLAALSLQWFRTTPYMVDLGMGPLAGGVVITKQAWEKLSPADRAKILEISHASQRRLEVEVPRQDTTSVAEMQKRGLMVAHVPPGRVPEWRAAATSFADRMRESIVPADVLDLARRERDAWRAAQAGGKTR